MPGGIFSRIDDQFREMETLLWRTRLDTPSSLLEHTSPTCVLISPTDGLVTSTSSPSVTEKLESQTAPTFSRFDMQDVEVIEVSMMAATVVYRVEAAMRGPNGNEVPYRAFCSSAWKQGADAEWTLCVHQETPY